MSPGAKKEKTEEIRVNESEKPGKKKSAGKKPTRQAAPRTRKKVPITLHIFQEREFFRDLPDATFVIDRQGIVLVWNRAMEELTGFSAAEILGKGDYCYAIPFYGERHPILIDIALNPDTRLPENYDNLCRENHVVTAITRYTHPRGEKAILSVRASPVTDENGTIIGAIESIRDITRQRQVEDHLSETEMRFRALAENTSDIIEIFDHTGKIFFDTKASGQILGYPPGLSLKEDPFGFIHPEDVERVTGEFSRIRENTRAGMPVEFRIRKADGNYIWAESVGKNMFGVPGIDGIVTTTRFIEERKKAELALQESEERYRTFISHSNEGIFRFETGCDIPVNLPVDEQIGLFVEHAFLAECNDAFARMYGRGEAEELVGCSIGDVMTIDSDDTLEYMRMFIRSGYHVENFESREKDREGTTRWFSNSLTGILQDGKVIRLWGVQREITERKQAGQQMEESEAKFRALFEGASDAIFIMNRMVFMDCNKSTEVIYGCSRDQIIGHSPAEFSPEYQPDGRLSGEKMKEKIDAALSGEPQFFEWVHSRYDGTPFNAEVALSRILLNGGYCLQAIVRDVTGRKRTEEQLRESEARYSSLFDNNYSISLLTDPDNGMIVDANDAAARYYGYSREQLTRMGVYDLNRLDRKTVIHNLTRRKKEGAKHFFSTHYLASGENRSVEVYSGPIMVHEKPLFYSIIHDVTDQRTAEAALKASEEHFRGIFENAPVGIFHALPEGTILDVNPAFARIFGYDSPEELIEIVNRHGIADTNYVHPELREGYVRKVIESGRWQTFENQYRRKDGSIIHSLLSFRPLPNPVSGRQELEGFVVDISSLKKAEEDLQKSRQILEGILNTIPVRVFWKDKDLVYIGCNTPFALDAGFEKPGDIIGKDDYAMGWHNQAELYRADDRLVIETGRIKIFIEEPQTSPSGDRICLLTSKVPLKDTTGEIIGVLGTYLDITDRKLMEEEIRSLNRVLEQRVADRTRELTQANERLAEEIGARGHAEQVITRSLEEKDLLLREIHHRVKNNLQIIASLLNLQSRFITDKKVLESIRDSQNRVRAMALVHERIYHSPEIGTINLAEYLGYLINQLFRFYNIPQTQVRVHMAIEDIPADIDTAIPIGLIINELVSNALKHAFPEGRMGQITVEGTRTAPDQLKFVFLDDGIGFPADYDWKNTTSLGLRLVRSLTKQLNGTVVMNQGGGTMYTITVKPHSHSGEVRLMPVQLSMQNNP